LRENIYKIILGEYIRMPNLPTNLYSLRHKNEFLGYSRHKNKEVKSLVFGFKNHTDIQLITDQIIRSKKFPAMSLDSYRRIVLHKAPPRIKLNELNVSDLLIDVYTSEEFMLRNSINGLDTCIVYKIDDLAQSFVLAEYVITKINNIPFDALTTNLDKLFILQ
jgi:hypothetical protein